MPGSYSSQQPSEGDTVTTSILQMSKLRLREGNLLNVAGPEIQVDIMDRKVLCKVCHKKPFFMFFGIPWKDVLPQVV